MNRIISAVAVLSLFCASPALSAGTVVLQAKPGNVTFNHQKHQNIACTKCHESESGGKIAKLNKEWAHDTCKGCHTEMKKGPVKCKECHQK